MFNFQNDPIRHLLDISTYSTGDRADSLTLREKWRNNNLHLADEQFEFKHTLAALKKYIVKIRQIPPYKNSH